MSAVAKRPATQCGELAACMSLSVEGSPYCRNTLPVLGSTAGHSNRSRALGIRTDMLGTWRQQLARTVSPR
jgi:hypothetical protein